MLDEGARQQSPTPPKRSIWKRITTGFKAFFYWLASFLPNWFKKKPAAPVRREESVPPTENLQALELEEAVGPDENEPAAPASIASPISQVSVPQAPVIAPLPPILEPRAAVLMPNEQEGVENIEAMYRGSILLSIFSPEQIVALPKIRGAMVRASRDLIRPLTQADLNGQPVVRGESYGQPFIGFMSGATVYTLFCYQVADIKTWKTCERLASDSNDGRRVDYQSLSTVSVNDLARLTSVLSSPQAAVAMPPLQVAIAAPRPQAPPSPLRPVDPPRVQAPAAAPQAQSVAIQEVQRLYSREILNACGVNHIANLPVVNINRTFRDHDGAPYLPDWYPAKLVELGAHRVIRGIHESRPFISYISTASGFVNTIFQDGADWRIIKGTANTDRRGHKDFGHDIPLVSVVDLRELTAILNANPAPRLR